MGACELEQFEFITEPLDYTQEQWDDKCYTCQAFAKDLEVNVNKHNFHDYLVSSVDICALLPQDFDHIFLLFWGYEYFSN